MRFSGRKPSRLRSLTATALCCACVLGLAWPHASIVCAQQSVAITGDRLSGFVLPVEPTQTDIAITALRATAWTVDDTKRLLLEGDVAISIGSYAFSAPHAVVWINRLPSQEGLINQIAIYFDKVTDPARQAGSGISGGQLLVTASSRGQIRLNVGLLQEQTPPRSSLLQRSEARLASYLQRLLAQPPALQSRPQLLQSPAAHVDDQLLELPSHVELPTLESQTPWLSSPQGTVRFSAGQVEIVSGEQENVIIITGDVAVEYQPAPRTDGTPELMLNAERAVIFTEPGPLGELASSGQLSAQSIRGIYLEGNVQAAGANDEYAIRSPHVYYDFQTDQAIMLNSLLRVQTRNIPVPVYARAEEMRQLSQNQWEAKRITVSTSEFHQPHLAIGADRAIITERPVAPGASETETHIDSRGNTMRVAGVPIVYWPRFSGTVEDVPLRSATIGTRDNDGLRLLTTWDLFALTGTDAPRGVDATIDIDGFTKRGAGLGLDLDYNVSSHRGLLDLYGLYDQGTDRSSAGLDVEPERELRGVVLWEHQSYLSEYWTAQAQLSLISDPTFITAWREDDFAERREYETSLYLKRQQENAALTILGKYSLNDFISNSYLLASRQYAVDKLPELTYRRYGDSLFGDRFTYSTENRVSRMRLVLHRYSPEETGLRGSAFGIPDDEQVSAALRARGYQTNFVSRFDSRHELSMPMQAGIFKVVPFVVGRITAYDDEFEDFSSDTDQARFFGATGLRIHTQFQRVDNAVESRLLDLHRLRHIIEPYVMLWYGYSTVSQNDLPVYDTEVESLADGVAVQLGVRNVWQTQRGGPGRWRSVDVLTLDASVVFDSEGEPDESPTPQFFEYRPEYSQFGDHVRAAAAWLLSDNLTIVGEGIYAIDPGVLARGSVGAELRHSPIFSTFVEYRYIHANDTELLAIGWDYQITPKYRLQLYPQYDFREEDFRAMYVRMTRNFPDFDLIFLVRYDRIRDDTTVGLSIGFVDF